MDKTLLKKSVAAGGKPAALIATCVGFFSDFVKPYINLVPYLFVISLLASGAIWFFLIRKKTKDFHIDQLLSTRSGVAFGVSVLATGFWLLMIPIFAITPERGVAATAVPPLGDWQEQLFGKLDRIEGKIDQVLDKIDQIKGGDAGLIGNPVTPNDFYHNARIHEINGNLIEAKKAYEAYFKSDLEYIDPYVSYSMILKNLEGPSTAREMMSTMRETKAESPSANLAYIMTKESREDRVQLLENLAQKHPDYGPIYYYIAAQYSSNEVGMPTNEERRKERDALQKMFDLEKDQKFSKFYVDKKLSDEQLSWADSEMKMLGGMIGNMIDQAIQFRVEVYNKSATVTFTPSEVPTKIYYRFNKQGDFKDTGTMGVSMPGMTEPLPNYYVMEALAMGEHVVEAKYVDTKGKESPVYEYKFSIDALKIMNTPYRTINQDTGKPQYMFFWSVYDDKPYRFFYSVDNQNLDRESSGGSGGVTLTDLPSGKHTLYVQGVAGSQKTNIAQMEFEVN